jgi:hypothetical protein
MARRKKEPKQNAKTIPQQIARRELITGGSAEAISGRATASARRQLIAGGMDAGGGGGSRTMVSAGVLPRNVRGGAITRAREQKVKVDKRTRLGRLQKTGVDVSKEKDVRKLGKIQMSKDRQKKIEGLSVGDKVKFNYYGKEREGTIKKISAPKGGFLKNVMIQSDIFKTSDKIKTINAKNIL